MQQHKSVRAASVAASILAALLAGCFPETTEVEGPLVPYVSVAAGNYHACGLTEDGQVFCWSSGDPRPMLVSGSIRFSSVSTRADHTCGLTDDGAAYCWGYNEYGQLGTEAELSTCSIRFSSATVPCSGEPMSVETDLRFQSISVGWAHTCAIDVAGKVHCWGLNIRGQLGAASDTACQLDLVPDGIPCSLEPIPVTGDLEFVALSAGQSHNCALTSDGSAYCWGAGGSGRLGTGSLTDNPIPARVAGGLTFIGISAGGNHSCAVAPDGMLYCWGSNAALQLGSKVSDDECGVQLSACVATPHPIAADLRFASVSASDAMSRGGLALAGHTCGIGADTEVYCWGLNESGQLAASNEQATSTPIRLPVDLTFTQISAGLANTCGVTTEGAIYCWAYGTPFSRWRVLSN
jgi:alpha-tubulin suppressor-like RCC1 family protein